MNILVSIGLLAVFVEYIVEKLKTEVLPVKWTKDRSGLCGLGMSIIICILLPYFTFMAEFFGDIMGYTIMQRIMLGIFVGFGAGATHDILDKLQK